MLHWNDLGKRSHWVAPREQWFMTAWEPESRLWSWTLNFIRALWTRRPLKSGKEQRIVLRYSISFWDAPRILSQPEIVDAIWTRMWLRRALITLERPRRGGKIRWPGWDLSKEPRFGVQITAGPSYNLPNLEIGITVRIYGLGHLRRKTL